MDDQRSNRRNRQTHMKIFIGADHRGYRLKAKITKFLEERGFEVIDVGTHKKEESSDYPQFSYKVGTSVLREKDSRGILVCMTGLGHAITANKIPGIRATVCYNRKAARLARAHNDSNVLVLGAKFSSKKEVFEIIKVWLKTPFDGGRHLRRINQIKKIERKMFKKI